MRDEKHHKKVLYKRVKKQDQQGERKENRASLESRHSNDQEHIKIFQKD